MNRQMRRAAQYKRGQRYDRNNSAPHFDAVLNRLALARTYDEEKAAQMMNDARMSWHRLTHGDGTMTDYDMVGGMINTAYGVAMKSEADEFVMETFERGMQSMADMRARFERTGKFGADAVALVNVPELLDALNLIYANITPLQALDALHETTLLIANGHVIQPMECVV